MVVHFQGMRFIEKLVMLMTCRCCVLHCSTHGLGAKDVFLQKTPISFDVSVRELFFPYSCGGCLVFAQPGGHRDTEYLAQLMAQQCITCASFVPSQLEVFLQVCLCLRNLH